MRWMTGIFILLLIAAIVIVIALPKKERIYAPIEREAPLPEEETTEKIIPPTPLTQVSPPFEQENAEPQDKPEM